MNTKRVFALVMVMVMVLVLTPERAAKALESGQTCPDCEQGKLIQIQYNSDQHAYSCSNPHCEHCTSTGYIWENHRGTATCTSPAQCEVCGQAYGSANPNAHDWSEWINNGDTHYRVCQRDGCDAREKKGHSYTWTFIDDSTCKGVCVCGAETMEAHYDRWEGWCDYQPHCEKCGQDYGTKSAHEMYYEDRGESGHKPSCRKCDTFFFLEAHTPHIAATCTSGPLCVCGAECGEPDTVNGHNWITDVAVAATCTATGFTEGRHCTRCGETVEQKEVPALGHIWITDEAKEPTCTETGLTEGKHCTRCGEILTKQEEVAALDHTWDVAPAVAPTCTKTGLTEGKRCTRCGETVAQTEVPALGHDWVVTGRTITRLQLVCRTCWTSAWQHNWNSRNLLPGLVRDEQGEAADYAAHISFIQAKRVMTLVPAGGEDEPVFLYLTAENVAEWVQEGLDAVIFRRGKSQLRIELKELSPDWFPLEAGQVPEGYAFHLQPQDGGWLVKAEALVGEKRIEARSLSGVTLTQGYASVGVPENGVYRFDG